MNSSRPTPVEVLARLDARHTEVAPDARAAIPSEPIEQKVLSLWSAILGRHDLSVHDDFFALGGDSILLTQLASRIRRIFNVEIGFGDFFDNPTIAGIAEMVRRADIVAPDGGVDDLISSQSDSANAGHSNNTEGNSRQTTRN